MTETQVVKFDVTEAAIAEMTELYGGLVITDLGDQEQYDIVHDAHMIVRGKRTAVDKKRKELKADALAWGKKVQSEANRIFALIEPLESHLKAEKQKVRDEQERLEQQRIAGIKNEIDSWRRNYASFNGMGTVDQLEGFIEDLEDIEINPEDYFEFVTDATDTKAELIARAKQDIETRSRLDKEESDRKAEADRLAKVKAEQDRVAAEQKVAQDKIDEDNRKIAEEKAKVAAEKARADEKRWRFRLEQLRDAGWNGQEAFDIQTDKVIISWDDLIAFSDAQFKEVSAGWNHIVEERVRAKAEQERKDREEFERQAKVKAEADAKAAAEQAEKDRLAAEKLRKEEEIRKAALLPDRDKLIEFSLFLSEEITYPNVNDKKADAIIQSAWQKINDLAESILKDAENL